MRLARLRAIQFRNFETAEIEFTTRITVLHGRNAQGKTNLLEAVYLLSNLQSFRTRTLRDLIQYGFPEARLQGAVEGCNGSVQLELQLGPGGRVARRDGKIPRSTSFYLSEFHTVLFSPQDLDIARGNQDLRRRLLDRAAFLQDSGHLWALRRYARALRQRNAALRLRQGAIDIWDDRLVATALPVYQGRRRAAEGFAPVASAIHSRISGQNEAIEFVWRSVRGPDMDLETSFREELGIRREKDQRLGFTTVGPHRDRMQLLLNGRRIEEHGSQGQARTASLSLKLGLLEWGRQVLGEEPVFLLDDPGSELDAERLGFLGRFLHDWPGQVIVAGTDPGAIPFQPGAERAGFRVSAGRVSAWEPREKEEEST